MLREDTKMEIMEINLRAIKIKEEKDGIIKVDSSTIDKFLNQLIEEEKYEDCQLIIDNKMKMIYSPGILN